MRSVLITLLILLTQACQCDCRKKVNTTNEEANSKAITRVLNEQLQAWNKGDIDGFMQGYCHSDDLKFITKRGVMMSYDSITARYKRAYSNKEKMGHLEFRNLVFSRLANDPIMYQVTGHWKISGSDSAGGNFSLLLKMIDKDWKIIVDHTW